MLVLRCSAGYSEDYDYSCYCGRSWLCGGYYYFCMITNSGWHCWAWACLCLRGTCRLSLSSLARIVQPWALGAPGRLTGRLSGRLPWVSGSLVSGSPGLHLPPPPSPPPLPRSCIYANSLTKLTNSLALSISVSTSSSPFIRYSLFVIRYSFPTLHFHLCPHLTVCPQRPSAPLIGLL